MGGYSLHWDTAKEKQFQSDTSKSERYVPGVLVPIAFLVGMSFGYEVLKWVSNRINRDSDSEYYNLFWSFQFLAALINGVHIWYMYNILAIAIVIPVPAFVIYAPIAVFWYYHTKREVPFTKSPCLCFSDTLLWKVIVNIFAVGNPFVFFVYMTYALPWIVLGFYLYPIKILVRISAIFTAAFCIIGISFVILKYLEEALSNLKQCYSNHIEKRNGYVSIVPHNTKSDETRSGELVCNVISAAMKCSTGVLVLVCIGFIGYLLYHIIFVLTSDVEEALVEVVHTLPLVVIPLAAYIIRKLMLLGNADTNNDSQTGSTPEEIEEFEHVPAEVPRDTEETREFEHVTVTAEVHAAGGGTEGITEEAQDNTG